MGPPNREPQGDTLWPADGALLEGDEAYHRRTGIGVLALEREHEGIGRRRLGIRSPKDKSWEQGIVASREEVH